jgi:thiol-disulfide isomerase/thioredoxin
MKRTITMLLVLSLFPLLTIARPVAGDDLAADYEALSKSIEVKMAGVKSKSEYEKLMAEREATLEAMLAKYASAPSGPALDLLRARILVDLKKYPEAEAKLNTLTGMKGASQYEAQLLKAKMLVAMEKIGEALPLFRQVEGKVAHTPDYHEVITALAFGAPDDTVRKEYCLKLLAAKDLPKDFARFRAYLYTTLAEIEVKKKDVGAAKKILQEGLKDVTGDREIKTLKSALTQLEFIGKPAPAISAEKWLNSDALALDSLKGKVVVIDFWAPWCPPCRQVIPTLAKDYNELKDKGLVVIGFTKLYGNYRDDTQNKGKVEADEERALIQGFVERWKLTYPIAISDKGEDFEDYGVSGIPTMVFIDKAGNIYEIKVGSGDEAAITAKIKQLLAEK